MNTFKRIVAVAAFGLVSFFGLQAATVSVTETKTHYPWNGHVDVTYDVNNVEAGSQYVVSAAVRIGTVDYPALPKTNITADGRYSFTWDAAEAGFTGRVEVARVVFAVDKPQFAVIDLATGNVSYLVDAPEYTDEYKTTKMVLKRLGENYVGVFEVTQKQYELVMGNNPAYFSKYNQPNAAAGAAVEAKRPVERISYEGITANGGFFDRLRELSGLPLALPTVAEWQAAARGNGMSVGKTFNIRYVRNSATNYYHALSPVEKNNTWLYDANGNKTFRFGMTGSDCGNQYCDATKGTAVVGSYAENSNGLYDMHGNVSEWTRSTYTNADLSVVGILCGGNYLSSAADCAVDADVDKLIANSRKLKQNDGREVYYTGFRVFGDAVKIEEGFVHETTVVSEPFAVDVAVDKTRYLTVADNAGTPVFTYYPTNGAARGWVEFDEGDKDWRPTKQGLNETSFALTGEKAYFYVKPLEIEFTVEDKTVVYDGNPQTIEPVVAAPALGYEVLYWCEDVPGQATEAEAKTNLVEFTGVKYDDRLEVTNRVINFKIKSDFYTTAATNALLTIEPLAITNAVVTLGQPVLYTGTAQTQTIESVTVEGFELQEGRDYTVVGNVATNFGTYVMTLTGVSNFVDNVSTNWTIGTKVLDKTAKIVFAPGELVYNGEEQTKEIYQVTVDIGGQPVPVTCVVKDNSNKGTNATAKVGKPYVCTVVGTGNFSGEASGEWEIAQRSVSDADVTMEKRFEYDGDPQEVVSSDVTKVHCPDVTGDVDGHRVSCDAKTNAGTDYKYVVAPTDLNYTGASTNEWSIAPRPLACATFTIDPNERVYAGAAQEPTNTISATDLSPKGAEAIKNGDWVVTSWEDNVNVGTAKANIGPSGTSNYTGATNVTFRITQAVIAKVEVKAACKTNVWDGTAKTVRAKDVTVTTENGLTLKTEEYYTAGEKTATDSGTYTVSVAPKGASPNFKNADPAATDTWQIVPSGPEIAWAGKDGKVATTNETDFPVFEYATKDLTVVFNAMCSGETLTIEACTNYVDGAWTEDWFTPVVSDNRIRVTRRTRIRAYAAKGGLKGGYSTVELVPGQCCDPVIWVSGKDAQGADLPYGATNFYRSSSKVEIGRTNLVNGVKPYDPQAVWDPKDGTIRYTLLDRTNGVLVADEEYDETKGFTVSSDAVTVIAQIKGQNYRDSIVKTQELKRVVKAIATPAVTIEPIPGRPSADRRVTFTQYGPGTNVWYAIDRATGTKEAPATANALKPIGKFGSADDEDSTPDIEARKAASTLATTNQFDITLALYESYDIKVRAYGEDGESDFLSRSDVAEASSVRDWTIGDALDAPDQEFYNGTNTAEEAYSPTNTPWTRFTNEIGQVGADCMRSGVLTKDGETSSLSTFVKGPGLLVFNWKANCVADIDPSQKNWDRGEFWLDGKLVAKIDGTNACWTTVTNILDNSVAQHALTWTYVKAYPTKEGGAIPFGEDCIYLDKFVWRPAPALNMLDGKVGPRGHVYGTNTVDDLVWDCADQVPTKTATTNYIHLTRNVYGANDEFLFTTNLVEGVDFTVDVTAKRPAGEYGMTLKATPETTLVTGEVALKWNIKPLDISQAVVEYAPTNFTYTGTAQGPAVKHLWVSHYLHAEPLDFVGNTGSWTMSGDTSETAAGSYSFKLVGKKNMTGTTADCNWKIDSKEVGGNISVDLEYVETTYDRTEQKPNVYATNTVSGVALTNGVDYTLSWSENCTTAGVKTVTLTGKEGGGYTGSTNLTYTIKKAVVESFDFNGASKIEYCGKEVTVDARNVKTDNGLVLDKTEWAFEDSGTTTYRATAVGDYTASILSLDTTNIVVKAGGVTKPWKIYQADVNGKEIVVTLAKDIEYTGSGRTIEDGDVTGVTVTLAGGPYSLAKWSFDENVQTNAGTYTTRVTADDPNVKGAADVQWEIVPRPLATNATITITTNLVWNGEATWAFTNNVFTRTIKTPATEQTVAFDVVDKALGNKKLAVNTDYTVDAGTDKGTAAGEYWLAITGMGNYAGSATTNWVIVPTVPLVKPNNANPTTNEIYLVSGETRVSMGCDVDNWAVKYVFKTADGTVRKDGTMTPSTRARYKGTASAVYTMSGEERTLAEAYTFVQGATNVVSDTVFVDYRIGTNVAPVVVLAYTNNVPMVDEFGNPCTNAYGYAITNFCHNGQLVALTRGNVVVSNLAEGVYQAYTNDAENAMYTDGTLRYTVDGTEPTESSPAWTAETRIAITNTTTVIAKVFGDQLADTACVTNVFVRDFEAYAPPKVTYSNEVTGVWTLATNGETVAFSIIGQRVRISDTNLVGGTIYFTTNSVTTNVYTEATVLSFDKTTTLRTWIGDDFDTPNYSASDAVAVEFSCDSKLATPVIAFSNATDVVVAKNDTVFTNAWQWIRITRGGDTFTRYTDGKIMYRFADDADYAEYRNPFKIWNGTNVYAYVKTGTSGFADSDVTNVVFKQEMAPVDAPVVTISPTVTVKYYDVVITNAVADASDYVTYYTLDGSEPVGINGEGKTPSAKFAGAAFAQQVYLEAGSNLTVRAKAYREVNGNTDFVAMSPEGTASTNRAVTIGDFLRPGAAEDHSLPPTPSTADLDATSSLADGNTEWEDDYGNMTNTCWVADYEVAYTNDVGGTTDGKSMRSGALREVATTTTTNGTNSVMTARVYGPGTFRFCWKASTEFEPDAYEDYVFDFCELLVDGEPALDKDGAPIFIYGTNDWTFVEYTIVETNDVAQMHEITWNYVKDEEQFGEEELGCEIEDCVWVDEFTWKAVPMMDQCDVYVGELTYNQQPQTPSIAVTNRATKAELVEGTDYAIDITPQTNASDDYAFVVRGLGTTYTGSNVVTWAIKPLSITNAVVKLSGGQMYDRKNGNNPVMQYAAVESIAVGAFELLNDTTWSLASGVTNATDAGTYDITLAGSDNLTGTVSTNWVIAPRPITADMIIIESKGKKQIVYSGIGTNVSFVLKYENSTQGLKADDYTVVPGSNIGTNAGNYKLCIDMIEGEGKNFTGSATQDWSIAKFDFDRYEGVPELTVTNFVYTGLAQTTDVAKVVAQHPYFGEIEFTNEAWVVSNNVATTVGEYWAKLYPTEGNLAGGPISNKWTISQADIKDVVVVLGPTNTYNGKVQQQTIASVTHPTIGALSPTDYTVKNDSKKVAGKFEMTLAGTGNWKGEKKVAWEQLPALIDSITFDPASYVYDGTEKTPAITVKAGELVAKVGTDFTTNFPTSVSSATLAGTNTVTVKGSYDPAKTGSAGNFKVPTDDLMTNVTWVIEKRGITNGVTVALSFTETTYNREEQKPNVYATNTVSGIALVEGTDYTLSWPENCTTAGVKTVTFAGKDGSGYTGSTNLTYTIAPAVITGFELNGASKIEYCGKEVTVDARNVRTENKLALDKTEYALEGNRATDVGDYTAELKSTSSNFVVKAGGLAKGWKIYPKDITGSEVLVVLKKPIVYTGKPQKIEQGNVEKIVVKSGTLLVKGCDISCTAHTDAGTYNDASVKATDPNFKGSAAVEWTIEKRDITDATAIVWDSDRLLWNGEEQTPKVKTVTVGGPDLEAGKTLDFAGSLATLTVDGAAKTEAGRYASTVTGTENFKGTTTLAQKWEIVPKSPAITPNDGTGKYTKIADWITVEINNDPADQEWSLWYTTNNWASVTNYVLRKGKFDIESHTVVEAYAVSCDGAVTGDISRCEYFFGHQNIAPTIALTAAEGAEKGRPTAWKNTEVKGEAKLIVAENGAVCTNFCHGGTKVSLTRFGAMTADEIEQAKKSTTYGGNCPYTDGEVWYTVAENGAEIVSPTNVPGMGSTKYDPADATTWPTIDTNAVVVARAFGDQLESSAEVTNVFQRLWTQMPKPDMTPGAEFQFKQTVEITTNLYDGADWTVTNADQKIYVAINDKPKFLYTNAFELTWADVGADGSNIVVKAVSTYGADYLDSVVETQTFTHVTTKYTTPTMTPSATFHHRNDEFGYMKGYEVTLTNAAPTEAGGELQYSYDGIGWTKYTESLWITNTTNVCARVAPTAEAHDYTTSDVVTNTFTYAPYQFVAPAVDKSGQTFYGADFTVTVSHPAEDPTVPDYEHVYHGQLMYSEDGGAWTRIDTADKTFTFSETKTLMFKQVEQDGVSPDHLESAIVSNTYTRAVKSPEIKLVDADGNYFPTEVRGGKTNYYHKAFLKMDCTGGDTHVEYTIQEEKESGLVTTSGTYTGLIAVSNTFTVTAVAKTAGGSTSAPVAATYTRKWEMLWKPMLMLQNPYGAITNKFWNTGDSFVITTNSLGTPSHYSAYWPTNVTFRYAVFTNSTIVVEDAELLPFVRGETVARFGADTNAVMLVVEAEDYLPTTNRYEGSSAWLRRLKPVGEPTVSFSNKGHRARVDVTIDMPEGANAVYYTYAITNDADGVATPWGSEYCVSNATDRYTNACFSVALKPREQLIVKARAYLEDGSSELVGVAETNFTARGGVAVSEPFSYDWTLADGLDDPDRTFTSTSSKREGSTAAAVEETNKVNVAFGDSSVHFKGVANSQWLSVETTVVGPGTVVFDWKTLCEKGPHGYNYDHMTFYVNGTPICKLDGDSGWQTVTNRINGDVFTKNVLKWVYEKDDSEHGSDGDDAWLDHFRWTSEATQLEITEDLDDWAYEYLYPDDYAALYNPDGSPNLAKWQEMLGSTSAQGRTYWECYVLGLDPEDHESELVITSPTVSEYSGAVSVTFNPRVAGRTYTLVGKKALTDVYWQDLAVMNATSDASEPTTITSRAGVVGDGYQFFQLRVKMTQPAK